jgi:hypothetical protein
VLANAQVAAKVVAAGVGRNYGKRISKIIDGKITAEKAEVLIFEKVGFD